MPHRGRRERDHCPFGQSGHRHAAQPATYGDTPVCRCGCVGTALHRHDMSLRPSRHTPQQKGGAGERPLVGAPWFIACLFDENVRHSPGHQPGRGGRVAAVAVGSPVRAMCEGHADHKVHEEPDCPWTKSIAEQAERRPSSPVGAHTANRQRAAIVLTRACTDRGAWCWSCAGWRTWGRSAGSAGTWRSGPAPTQDGRCTSR